MKFCTRPQGRQRVRRADRPLHQRRRPGRPVAQPRPRPGHAHGLRCGAARAHGEQSEQECSPSAGAVSCWRDRAIAVGAHTVREAMPITPAPALSRPAAIAAAAPSPLTSVSYLPAAVSSEPMPLALLALGTPVAQRLASAAWRHSCSQGAAVLGGSVWGGKAQYAYVCRANAAIVLCQSHLSCASVCSRLSARAPVRVQQALSLVSRARLCSMMRGHKTRISASSILINTAVLAISRPLACTQVIAVAAATATAAHMMSVYRPCAPWDRASDALSGQGVRKSIHPGSLTA